MTENPTAKLRIDPENPKYALIKMARVRELHAKGEAGPVFEALESLRLLGVVDYGYERENEFFVLRLRDQYSDDALYRYSLSARYDGESDYALQIEALAARAGVNHPNCKKPD